MWSFRPDRCKTTVSRSDHQARVAGWGWQAGVIGWKWTACDACSGQWAAGDPYASGTVDHVTPTKCEPHRDAAHALMSTLTKVLVV